MPAAASALFYLWSRTLMNLVLSRLRRLKQPKYLFGAVLALAYLYFLFIYPTLVMERTDAERAAAVPEELVTWLALAMLAFCALSWVWWRKRMVLQMTDAEIASVSAYASGLSGSAAPSGSTQVACLPGRRAGAGRDAAPSPLCAGAAARGAG